MNSSEQTTLTSETSKEKNFMDPIIQIFITKVASVILDETVKNLPIVLENLKKSILSKQPDEASEKFPTASLLGLGRCGSNVCIEVAERLRDNTSQTSENKKNWLQRWLSPGRESFNYLFQPAILLADTDNILNSKTAISNPITGYKRCKIIDLSWIFSAGAGNLPLFGQFITKLALSLTKENAAKSIKDNSIDSWFLVRNYVIDTIGLSENKTRLLFSVFSTGGGTGAGMSIELGEARAISDSLKAEKNLSLSFEKACAIGIGVLPEVNRQSVDARVINTGRFLCSYLSKCYKAKSDFKTFLPFDSIILVSNQLIYSTLSSKNQEESQKLANIYISQQIANLLSAQAMPSDYYSTLNNPQDSIKNSIFASIEKAELSRLDPNDLRNSLSGLITVAYAESKTLSGLEDLNKLFLHALAQPKVGETGSVEGISISPAPQGYFESIDTNSLTKTLTNIKKFGLFKRCSSLVAVLAIPEIKIKDVKREIIQGFQSKVMDLFENSSIRRYAIISSPGDNFGLSIFISSSGCISGEVQEHLLTYIANCFVKEKVKAKEISQKIKNYIRSQDNNEVSQLEQEILDSLNEKENIGVVLPASLGEGHVEKRKQELITISKRFFSEGDAEFNPNELLLTKVDILNTLKYLRDTMLYEPLIYIPYDEGIATS